MSSISLNSIDIVDRFSVKGLKVNHLNKSFNSSLATCEHNWSYVSRTSTFTRHFLNALVRTPRVIDRFPSDFPEKVGNIGTHFRLFSAIGLPLGVVSTFGASEKFWKSLSAKDKEGIALNGLSLSIEGADLFDSITTVVNAALAFFALPAVGLYATLGLPIGCAISVLGTISRTIRIAKGCKLYQGIGEHLRSGNSLRPFLEKNYGVAPEEIFFSPNSKAALLRATSPAVVAKLEKHLIVSNEEGRNELQAVRIQLRKQICFHALAVVANMVVLAGLILFILAITTAMPFILLSAGLAFRIGALIYQDHYL